MLEIRRDFVRWKPDALPCYTAGISSTPNYSLVPPIPNSTGGYASVAVQRTSWAALSANDFYAPYVNTYGPNFPGRDAAWRDFRMTQELSRLDLDNGVCGMVIITPSEGGDTFAMTCDKVSNLYVMPTPEVSLGVSQPAGQGVGLDTFQQGDAGLTTGSTYYLQWQYIYDKPRDRLPRRAGTDLKSFTQGARRGERVTRTHSAGGNGLFDGADQKSGRPSAAVQYGNMAGRAESAESDSERLVRVLQLWNPHASLSGGRSLRLGWRTSFPAAASQGAIARCPPLLCRSGVWRVGSSSTSSSSVGTSFVSLR